MRGFTLIGAVCLALAAMTAVAAGEPRLAIDETEFDFGKTPNEQTVSHIFWLKSVGDDTLEIVKVTTSCGCTKAPVEKSKLAPGDSTRLELIFSTQKYRRKTSRTARVFTNAAKEPHVLKIAAEFVVGRTTTEPLMLAPRRLIIRADAKPPQKAVTFTLRNQTDEKLDIRLIDWPGEILEVMLPSTISPGETAVGRVTILAGADKEPFKKSITLESGNTEITRFTIPIIYQRQSQATR